MSKRLYLAQSTQWLSRSIAVILFMIAPGLLGSVLDKRMGTRVLTPIGFLIGMLLGTTALVVLAKHMSPPARGRPLPTDDEPSEPRDPDISRQVEEGLRRKKVR